MAKTFLIVDDEVRIADIIMAVDEPIKVTRCKHGSPEGCRSNKSRCLTHDLWEGLGDQIHLYLSSISLADIVHKRVLSRRNSGTFGGQIEASSVAAE